MDLIKDPDGAHVRVLGGVRDVTELRTLNALLTQRQRLFESLTTLTGGFVWRADLQGRVTMDMSWCAFTGAGLAQSQGDGWLSRLHAEDRAAAAWRQAVETGAPFAASFRLGRPDGSYTSVEAQAHPIYDADSAILEWIGHCRPLHAAAPEPTAEAEENLAHKLRPRDLKAARTFLDWSVQDLARASGVSTATISRFEASETALAAVRSTNQVKLIRTLQDAGVRFETDQTGVCALRLG